PNSDRRPCRIDWAILVFGPVAAHWISLPWADGSGRGAPSTASGRTEGTRAIRPRSVERGPPILLQMLWVGGRSRAHAGHVLGRVGEARSLRVAGTGIVRPLGDHDRRQQGSRAAAGAESGGCAAREAPRASGDRVADQQPNDLATTTPA